MIRSLVHVYSKILKVHRVHYTEYTKVNSCVLGVLIYIESTPSTLTQTFKFHSGQSLSILRGVTC